MEPIERWRERLTNGIGSLLVSVREIRLDALRQQAAALWAGRAGLHESKAFLVVGTAVALAVIVILSVRDATSRTGEHDFDYPMVCAECGRRFSLSREAMFDAVAAARNKGFATAGQDPFAPVGICPKCGKFALYRAKACPKCGKLLVPRPAPNSGGRAALQCPGCGWSAKPQGG